MNRRIFLGLLLLGRASAETLGAWQLVISRHTEARGPSRYLEIRLNSQGLFSTESTTTASVMRRKPIVEKREGKLEATKLRAIQRLLQAPDLGRQQVSSPSLGPTHTTLRILRNGTFREYSSAAGTLSPSAELVISEVEKALPRN